MAEILLALTGSAAVAWLLYWGAVFIAVLAVVYFFMGPGAAK